MIKKIIICLAVGVIGVTALLWHFRSGTPDNQHEGATILKVACTTSMLTDLLQNIVGDRARVQGLMGPGVDPHLYRARAGDVQKLNDADIIFFNGLDLEGKLGELFRQMSKTKKTVAVAEMLDRSLWHQSDFAQMYDPHIWHDVSLWHQLVMPVARIVAESDPEHAEEYISRAEQYATALNQLHQQVKSLIETIPKQERILVTAHDAFGYFGTAYEFQVVGLQGISTDAEVGAYDIQHLANFIASHKVPAIFIESSIPQRNIEAVQKAVDAKGWHTNIGPELYSDALGDYNSDAGTYIGMIQHNTSKIVDALKNNEHEQK